jgi:hypothetical protein
VAAPTEAKRAIERAAEERDLPVAVFLEVALRRYLVDTGYIDEEAAN